MSREMRFKCLEKKDFLTNLNFTEEKVRLVDSKSACPHTHAQLLKSMF